jgi:hypothetical protein
MRSHREPLSSACTNPTPSNARTKALYEKGAATGGRGVLADATAESIVILSHSLNDA